MTQQAIVYFFSASPRFVIPHAEQFTSAVPLEAISRMQVIECGESEVVNKLAIAQATHRMQSLLVDVIYICCAASTGLAYHLGKAITQVEQAGKRCIFLQMERAYGKDPAEKMYKVWDLP